MFYVVNKQSFGGKIGIWGVDIKRDKQTRAFFNFTDKLQGAYERLKNVQIERSGFEYIIKRYDRENTFLYLDPPYAFNSERSNSKVYKYEMTDGHHEKLVDILLNIKSKVMLSGYDTPIYDRLGWRKIEVGKSTIAVQRVADGGRQKKAEYIWVNY